MDSKDTTSDGRVQSLLGGRYLVLKRIEGGAQGDVFVARDKALFGRLVILKIGATHGTAALRQSQEAHALSRIRHPNVCQLLERNPEGFLVLEFAGEVSLERVLASRSFDVLDGVRWMEQIAAALGAGHAARVIHADVKPANVVLSHDMRVAKLVDFGLAVPAGEASAT